MFHVGQRVVCVDDEATAKYSKWPCSGGMDGLKKGVVYTIRATGEYRGVSCIWIEEISRPKRLAEYEYGELGFAVQRFRPIEGRSTETGMAILRDILNTKKEKA